MRFKGKDILLLLLYAKGKTLSPVEPIVGTTRLSKAFFLFEEEMKEKFTKDQIDELPEFIAWNYGPWSKQLLDDIEFFSNINFLKIDDIRAFTDVSLVEPTEYQKLEEEQDIDEIKKISEEEQGDIYLQKKYTLTTIGKQYVEEKLWPSLSDAQIQLLQEFKSKINSMSLFSLLRYVYKNYSKAGSDWTRNSLIKAQVL